MTNDKIALHTLLEKTSNASKLRDMIGFAAERLMALETEPLCGAAPGERSAGRLRGQEDERQGEKAVDLLIRWRRRGLHAFDADAEATKAGMRAGSNGSAFWIAVGTPITKRPPHRTVRAEFPHTAPTLGV